MTEYNIGFAKHLISAAEVIIEHNNLDVDAMRTVLYLSNLACEILLKAFLEKAGCKIKNIRKRNHDLSGLLDDIGELKVIINKPNGRRYEIPATSLRGIVVDKNYGNATVGNVLAAEKCGASKYPTEIRYGDTITNYPPAIWLNTAIAILDWMEKNINRVHPISR